MVKPHCTLSTVSWRESEMFWSWTIFCRLANCSGIAWNLPHKLKALGTCDIFGVDGLPLGKESPVCEAIVRLKVDSYGVAGTDH